MNLVVGVESNLTLAAKDGSVRDDVGGVVTSIGVGLIDEEGEGEEVETVVVGEAIGV